MKILLGDFNAEVGKENIFKPTIGNESLHQDSNGNGVRIVNFATSKNSGCKSTMFPHRDIHKYILTSPYRKTHSQIDHILIDRRWHSSMLDVRKFRGDDCDTDHNLVVAKARKGSKSAAQKFKVEILNLRKLYDLEFRKQYQIEILNRLVTLENLNDNENILRAWENIKENIRTSAKESLGLHELQQRKPWFDEEC